MEIIYHDYSDIENKDKVYKVKVKDSVVWDHEEIPIHFYKVVNFLELIVVREDFVNYKMVLVETVDHNINRKDTDIEGKEKN